MSMPQRHSATGESSSSSLARVPAELSGSLGRGARADPAEDLACRRDDDKLTHAHRAPALPTAPFLSATWIAPSIARRTKQPMGWLILVSSRLSSSSSINRAEQGATAKSARSSRRTETPHDTTHPCDVPNVVHSRQSASSP